MKNLNDLFKKKLTVTKAHADMALGLFFSAFAVFMLVYGVKKWASVSFGSVGIVTDRLFPYIVMTMMLICAVCIFIMGLLDSIHDKKRKAAGESVATVSFSIFIFFMAVLAFFVVKCLKPLGYPLTITISMLAVYFMLGGKKLWQGLLVSVGFAVLSYLFFAVYLGVSLQLGFGL